MAREDARERFLDSNDRFQEAMLAAIRAHQEGVIVFTDLLRSVDEREAALQESVEELKRLVLEQGAEIRQLRTRLNGG